MQFKEDIETSNALAIPGTIILEIGNELWICRNHLVHCNHDHGSRPSHELKGCMAGMADVFEGSFALPKGVA